MNRLEKIVKSDRLLGKRILVTGCGYERVKNTFYDITTGEPTHNSIIIDGQEMKLNIGSAIAAVLALNGANVHMVSRTEEKLRNIKEAFSNLVEPSQIEYSAVDLLDEKNVRNFVDTLYREVDMPLYWCQSIGLGAGAYKVKEDNPYLHIDQIPTELLEKETLIVLKGTHILMQKLLPIFREQNKHQNTETRIVIISSMSAIRGYNLGGTHCAAKGAISRYTNSAMLDLWKERIFITDIRPGAIDTGMYDGYAVQNAVKAISNEYGGIYKTHFALAPPTSVGEAVNYVFTTPAHITSLNLVARGQFPNEGS